MGSICAMTWNAQPSLGTKRKKLMSAADFMTRKPKRRSQKKDPAKAADDLIKRLDSYQRARDTAKQKK